MSPAPLWEPIIVGATIRPFWAKIIDNIEDNR